MKLGLDFAGVPGFRKGNSKTLCRQVHTRPTGERGNGASVPCCQTSFRSPVRDASEAALIHLVSARGDDPRRLTGSEDKS
jgi:hypothetical protein